jgi:excisionase family DNA binding protein
VHDGSSQACPVAPPTDATNTEAFAAPPFLSFREAADWLCVSLSTLQRMIAKGDLSAIRVGKRRKIPAGCLAAYVARDILIPKDGSDAGMQLVQSRISSTL